MTAFGGRLQTAIQCLQEVDVRSIAAFLARRRVALSAVTPKKTDLDLKRGGSRVDGLLGGSELDSLPTKFLKEGTLLATRPKSAENLGAFARSPRVALTHERARKWGTSVSAGGAHDKSH